MSTLSRLFRMTGAFAYMKIQELLQYGQNKLKHTKSPHLDAEVLLSYVINKPREYVLTHSDEDVPADKIKKFNDLITRRAKHEPVAYLINKKEFYGRDFHVDNRVHIPRPATEDIVDAIKNKLPADFSGTIADIGTGSGIIAITLALEFPRATIIATDISQDALKVAQQNTTRLNVAERITFLLGDLLDPLKSPVDIIVANLPYGWKGGWTDDREVFFQPKKSFDGGKNGLIYIKKLITDLPNHLNKDGQCFLEFDPRQKNAIIALLSKTNFKFNIIKDSENHNRIAFINPRDPSTTFLSDYTGSHFAQDDVGLLFITYNS